MEEVLLPGLLRFIRSQKLLLCVSAWLLAAAPAGATMAERLSLEQLVERSERIVQGRCERTWSDWDAKHQSIWTHWEIQVTEPIKGGPVTKLVISEPGGIVGDVGMLVEGVPHYEPGEEIVLFLYKTPIGYWRSRGLGQGKYGIARDPQTGIERVHGDSNGVALIDRTGAATPATDLRPLDGMQLSEFKGRVRAVLLRQGGGIK